MRKRWRVILPGAYVLLALAFWLDFARTAHDGLANVGLMLAVLPVTVLGLLLGWALGAQQFVLMPERFGYLGNHAAFYVPSVIAITLALFLLGGRLDRRP